MSQEKENKTKQEKVKYKFGQKELDLENYIYNLGTNVQSYIDSKNWSEGQKQEFKQAYDLYLTGLKDQLQNNSGRFSTDDFGIISDNTGVLTDVDSGSEYYYDDKGQQLSVDDYNALKEKKKKNYNTFSANREVAAYFNNIGKAIKTKSESSKPKFNVSKHGFVADWTNNNSTSGEKILLKPYLDMDAYDPVTKKRGRSKRLEYLTKEIERYLENFDDGAYDFTGSPYKTSAEYRGKLETLLEHMRDGQWTNDDMIAANQAGIGGSFYEHFFTEDETVGKTEEQRKQEEEAAKKKELQEKQDTFIKDALNRYRSNNYQYTKGSGHHFKLNNDYFDEQGNFDSKKFNSSFPLQQSIDQYINDYLLNPYDTTKMQKAWAGLIGSGYAKRLSDGRYYVPQARNNETQSVLIYDPNENSIYHSFIGEVQPEWQKIIDKYNLDNGIEEEHTRYRFAEGGVIQYQLGGGFSMDAALRDMQTEEEKQRAELSGRSLKQQQAGERNAGLFFGVDEDPSKGDPNAGFSATDLLRLGTIGADIVSAMTAWAPGWGTAASAGLGFASTAGTFIADAVEDGLDAGDFKNVGLNLGMDILGLIPIGGSTSKWAKITRNVVKWVPRLMAAVSVSNTIANKDAILASLGKVTSEPTKLTVDDWRNIAQGIGTVAGIVGGLGRSRKVSAEPVKDKVAVEMVDKTTKQKRTYVFEGDDAKSIRKASESGDIDALKKATIDKFELNDMELSTTSDNSWVGFDKNNGKSIFNPSRYRINPFGTKDSPRVFDVEQTFNYKGHDKKQTVKKEYVSRGKREDDILISDTYSPGKTRAEVDAEIKASESAILDDLRKQSSKVQKDLDAGNVKSKGRKTKLEEYRRLLNGDTESSLNDRIAQIKDNQVWFADSGNRSRFSKLTDLESQVRTAEIDARTAQAQYDAFKFLPKSDSRKINAATAAADAKIKLEAIKGELEKFKADNVGSDTWQSRFDNSTDTKLSEAEARLNDVKRLEAERKAIQAEEDSFQNTKKQYEEGTKHTKAFNSILKQFGIKSDSDIIVLDRSSFGRDNAEMSLKDFLNSHGVTTYYKKGGSFEHVRKFKDAGKITNTTSTANWFDDMFQSKEMTDWLYTLNKDNFEQFNNLQKSWATNKKNTGYTPGSTEISSTKDEGVWNRQAEWNKTGTNAVIDRAVASGKIKQSGTTGDNKSGNYQDGFFGEQEFLRHGGTKQSWEGREKELKAFQDVLKSRGLNYTLDNESGMYLLSAIAQPETPKTPVTTANPGTTRPVAPEVTTPQKNTSSKKSYLENIKGWLDDPTVKYGIPRALYADAMNRNMTELALAGEQSYLQNPLETHRTVQSNLNSEMQGQQSAAQLMTMASKPLTSDGALQTATQLEAANKAQQFINQGKTASDQAYRTSSEAAFEQEKENAKNRHQVAAQNNLAMLQTQSNKNKIELAYQNKKHEIYDTLAKQFEYDERVKQQENKARQDAFAQSDIHNAVSNDPNSFGAELTEEELKVWTKMMAGADYTDLDSSTGEDKLYLQARKKVSQAEQRQLSEYYKIPQSRWSRIQTVLNEEPNPLNIRHEGEYKKGGKLEVAGIKAKTANAERFQKNILESIKRNDKILDRVSKSMYGYIKSSIV